MTDETRPQQSTIDDDEFVNVVYQHTPAGTTEVADTVGISRQATEYRLKKLEDQGRIWSKKIGPTRIWMSSKLIHKP